jgi:hypothetical protein
LNERLLLFAELFQLNYLRLQVWHFGCGFLQRVLSWYPASFVFRLPCETQQVCLEYHRRPAFLKTMRQGVS